MKYSFWLIFVVYFAVVESSDRSREVSRVFSNEGLMVPPEITFEQTLSFKSGCSHYESCQTMIKIEKQRARKELETRLLEKIKRTWICETQQVHELVFQSHFCFFCVSYVCLCCLRCRFRHFYSACFHLLIVLNFCSAFAQ